MNFRISILIVSIFVSFVSCNSTAEDDNTLFTKLSPEKTGVTFVNTNTPDAKSNILSYEYFYNGGGVALGDINNDGLVDIYFSANQGDNKLYLNKGNFDFEDITDKAGVMAPSGWRTGVAMVDINHDGFLDIYVCRSGPGNSAYRTNSLFINSGNLTFTDQAKAYGLDDTSFSTQAAFLDHDNDGDLDMFLLNHSRLTISNSYDVGKRYDNQRVRYVGNKLYRNDNDKFTDVSDSLGVFGPASNYGLGVVYSDINEDGWTDLYTTNDYTEKDKFLINDHGRYFRDESDSLFTHMSQFSMGTDMADINNDGYYDLITVDMLPETNKDQKEIFWPDKYDVFATMVKNGRHYQYMRNMLQLNNGNGTFSEIGQIAGISNTNWSWAPLFADLDNDGFQDLFVSNGFKHNFTNNDFLKYGADLALKLKEGKEVLKIETLLSKIPAAKVHNYVYKNTNGTTFEDVSVAWGLGEEILSNGAAYGDLDNDGDLDLVTNVMDSTAGIYRNNADRLGAQFLKIKLEGKGGNTFGLGASATLYHSKGKMMTRTLCPYRGFQSSVEPALNFGLGKITYIDSLIIQWPGGAVQRLTGVSSNQTVIVKQDDAIAKAVVKQPVVTFFKPAQASIPYKHQENDFIDFKVQSLLPRSYSTMGPAAAQGDVNGDGLADLFAGGALGQRATLLLQGRNGGFIKKEQSAFQPGAEDIDAAFVDIDKDNDLDLYVVTGGYEFESTSEQLQDKLYRNDGKGNFAPLKLPEMFSSGSCVRPADIDQDGDMDLFVGGRIIPGRYPEAPESYLLINDGKGNFSIATTTLAPGLDHIGMVTDAVWEDLNRDGFPDLILAGEWMPITVYIQENGKLVDKSDVYIKDKTHGWWNTLQAVDVDGDGDRDIVAGNFGQNNQYKPSPEKPVTLYYSDFDKNGSVDPILNYFIGDKSYPAPTRDELTEQIPSFKKRFPDYASYAAINTETLLQPAELAAAGKLVAYRFESALFVNNTDSFVMRELPRQLQFAPIFAFGAMDVNGDGAVDLVAGGNLSKMGARLGKAYADFGSLLLGDGKGGFVVVPPVESGLVVRGDVRKIIVNNNQVIMFRNNNTPVVYSITTK